MPSSFLQIGASSTTPAGSRNPNEHLRAAALVLITSPGKDGVGGFLLWQPDDTSQRTDRLEAEIRTMIHTDWGPDGSKSKVQAQAVLDVLQLELGMLKPDSPYLGHYDL